MSIHPTPLYSSHPDVSRHIIASTRKPRPCRPRHCGLTPAAGPCARATPTPSIVLHAEVIEAAGESVDTGRRVPRCMTSAPAAARTRAPAHGRRQCRDVLSAVARAELLGGEELEHGAVAVVAPGDPLSLRRQDMAQPDALDELARGVVSLGHLGLLAVLAAAWSEAVGPLSRCCTGSVREVAGLCACAPA